MGVNGRGKKGECSSLGRNQELRKKDAFARRLFFLEGSGVSWENQGADIGERTRLVRAWKTNQINVNNMVVKRKSVFKQQSVMKCFRKNLGVRMEPVENRAQEATVRGDC